MAPSVPSLSSVLERLPVTLRQRINPCNEFTVNSINNNNQQGFILYLPTVVLRKQHNPAFALACHLANAYHVPVIVLAIVLDDTALLPMPHSQQQVRTKPIVFTARRIAFVLEALQSASQEWQEHGAGVAIRMHGNNQARTPHHLTLAHKATVVVTDEPFVHPYRALVETTHRACQSAQIPLLCVDGSTTVPPCSILTLKQQQKHCDAQGRTTVLVEYQNVPNKAWKWNDRTKAHRKGQVHGVVKEGHFDAPELQHKLGPNFFLDNHNHNQNQSSTTTTTTSSRSTILHVLPADWRDVAIPSPGKRPWTVQELASISNLKEWVMTSAWPGIDTSVPPCSQTHGSSRAGLQRWQKFYSHHLHDYAKLRNNITKPHAVSRMSCYLNYGVVSIFQVVHELWVAKQQQQGASYNKGAAKFEDEVIKWREIGYVHAFAYPNDYNRPSVVPAWASKWITAQQDNSGESYSLEALETGTTTEDTWNAMQHYLVETGELHNNARMTWGKTMVHWQKHDHNLAELLQQLVYINDRYALDGLSPPSYAGLLWCLGWCDKPSNAKGAISEKPASRYRTGKNGFLQARQSLLAGSDNNNNNNNSVTVTLSPANKKQKPTRSVNLPSDNKRQKSIDSYFKVAR